MRPRLNMMLTAVSDGLSCLVLMAGAAGVALALVGPAVAKAEDTVLAHTNVSASSISAYDGVVAWSDRYRRSEMFVDGLVSPITVSGRPIGVPDVGRGSSGQAVITFGYKRGIYRLDPQSHKIARLGTVRRGLRVAFASQSGSRIAFFVGEPQETDPHTKLYFATVRGSRLVKVRRAKYPGGSHVQGTGQATGLDLEGSVAAVTWKHFSGCEIFERDVALMFEVWRFTSKSRHRLDRRCMDELVNPFFRDHRVEWSRWTGTDIVLSRESGVDSPGVRGSLTFDGQSYFVLGNGVLFRTDSPSVG